MNASQWSFDPVGGAALAVMLGVAFVAIVIGVRPQETSLSPRQRGTLVGLRSALWLLLLLAWLRPTLLSIAAEPIATTIAVLVDSSRSMQVEDASGGRSRWEVARQSLRASAAALAKLAQRDAVRVYQFDSNIEAASVAADGGVALGKEPAGERSALGAAIDDAAAEASAGRLTAVVLLSDGAERDAADRDAPPLAAARRLAALGTPLLAAPLGDRATGTGVDVRIEELRANENVFAGAPLEVRARLTATGLPNRRVVAQLLWENADGGADVVRSQPIVIRPGQTDYAVSLTHTPLEPGEWKLTVTAPAIKGETVTANNTQSTFVNVREGGVRVLYFVGATRRGGSPGREQRFVAASLAASPDVSVERLAFDYRQPGRDLAERFRVGAVDIVVLDNLDAIALDAPSWRALAEGVADGLGLLVIGGYHSYGPGGYRDLPLAEVLPLGLGRAERQAFGQPVREDVHLPGPLRMTPVETADGVHPILRIGDEPRATWAELPPLLGANRFDPTRLRLNAAVLAEADNAQRSPLLVAGQPGLGRVLAMAGDSTFQWVLAGQGEAHRRFWRQAALWLVKKDELGGEAVRLRLSARRVNAGERLDATVDVRLPNGVSEDSAADLRYTALVELPGGGTKELPFGDGRVRSTGAFFSTLAAGDYRARVTATLGGQTLGEASARFLVTDRDVELDRPAAEPDRLTRMARATADVGGRVIAPEELPDVLAELAERPAEERRRVTARYTPWDDWPFFLLIVGLMGAEWGLRKRWRMP
ncbi:MAG: glutamine amidotransferase [Planctomycetota bacterium]